MAICLNNVINIKSRSCGSDTPSSGLYLDMLGINMDWLNSITQMPYKNGEDLFTNKLEFSAAAISHNIVSRFADKFRANTIVNGQRIGFYNDNLQVVAGEAGYLKGIEVELCNDTSFVDFFLSNISLQTNFSGSVPILVYDLIQNKLLDTLTVTTVAGEVSVLTVNKTYKSNRKQLHLILVYDTTAINSYKSYVKKGGCTDCTDSGALAVNS